MHSIIFRYILVGAIYLYSAMSFLAAQVQMERLDRGLVAVRTGTNSVFLSWRWLGTEGDISYNIYRSGTKINTNPIQVCNFTDNFSGTTPSYSIRPVIQGVEGIASQTVSPWSQRFLRIPLQQPSGGKTPDGVAYTYTANDCSVGDANGDGQLEVFLKWDPTNAKDNSQRGYTGNVYIDCYTLSGQRLWRIDLGPNIRAGAHYTQFLVYDFDGDGKVELACKTADGTMDAEGTVIGSASADYRNSSGYILDGPEYLTVFHGENGKIAATTTYIPARGSVRSWGDDYGNRVDRFVAAVAYLDGQRPSMVFGRGYYTRLVRAAWDYRNGQLIHRWTFDSNISGNAAYAGQGNHQMSVADVDGDGRQEICNGASIIDDDGRGLFTTTHGHGDALHLSDMDPDRLGQEIWMCQEEPNRYGNFGLGFIQASNGTPIWGLGNGNQGDIGRALAADIDPRHKGYECWGSTGPLYTCKGQAIGTTKPTMNFAVYWDGDLQRELLDGNRLEKWNYSTNSLNRLATLYLPEYGNGASCNGTKATPNLSGDILGDWREEIILHASDESSLLIYTTTNPTSYKFTTLLHDPQYRVALAWQNSGYNQPPHLSYYLGQDMNTPLRSNITIAGNRSPILQSLQVTYIQPSAGTNNNGTIRIDIQATDPDNRPLLIELYEDNTFIQLLTSAPYTYTINQPYIGTHTILVRIIDDGGLTVTETQTVLVLPRYTSAKSAQTLSINCFPNPYAESFQLEGEGEMTYTILDVVGRIIESGVLKNTGQVGGSLPSGQYILKVQEGENQFVTSILKL
ncbi:MAG: Ig-like domain-containing protein [Cytophagaceae bacterium]|nr:Ig-like domain-containing protein [Cytophagaceae bacterium]